MPRKPKATTPEENASKQLEEKEKNRVAEAKQFLLEDADMKIIFDHLKIAAEKGNPAARTLYGVFHLFIGSNIPEKQDESYAEAVKWFYMNRRGDLECKLLQNIITNTSTAYMNPAQLYNHASRLAATAKHQMEHPAIMQYPPFLSPQPTNVG